MASHRSLFSARPGLGVTSAVLGALFFGAVACSSGASSSGTAPNAGDATFVEADAAAPEIADAALPELDAATSMDASPDALVPNGICSDTFGRALTPGFGRIDGVVYAVQKPSDTSCTLPNRDHVVLQILMNDAVYRLVVNVQSSRAGADPKIRVGALPHALPAPAFAEGWHLDAPLDYVTSLGAHSDATFAALTLEEATAKIASALAVGAPVAVYATNGAGKPESAHNIHRNAINRDGAIVVNPTASPTFILFHFDNQAF